MPEPTIDRPVTHRPVARRTLARNLAWSVPLIAATAPAPAFAASPCDVPTGSIGSASFTFATTNQTTGSGSATASATYTRSSSTSAVATSSDPDGTGTVYSPVTLGLSATTIGTNININSFNLVPYYSGGVVGFAASQQQNTASNANRANNGQALTFTFIQDGAPVTLYNLKLTIADVTSATAAANTYWDSLEVTGAAFTAANGGQVTGTGLSSTNRIRALTNNTDPNFGDLPASSTTLTFPAASSFTLRYFSESTTVSGNNNGAPGFQGITIGPFSFNMKPTACP